MKEEICDYCGNNVMYLKLVSLPQKYVNKQYKLCENCLIKLENLVSKWISKK